MFNFNFPKRLTIVKVFVLAAFIIVSIQSSALAENTERLEVVNESEHDIKALYIVPSGNKSWGNDLVGSWPLEYKQTKIIYYDPTIRYFKVRMVFTDDKSFIWENDNKVDFSGAWRITIYYDGEKYRISKNAVG